MQFSTIKKVIVPSIDASYVKVASHVLPDLLKLGGKETRVLEPVNMKHAGRWVRGGEFVRMKGVEAAPRILVVPYLGNELKSAAKYVTPSFETKKKFLYAGHCGRPQKKPFEKIFFTRNERKGCVEILRLESCNQSSISSCLSYSVLENGRRATIFFTSLGFYFLQPRFVPESRMKNASNLLKNLITKLNILLHFASNRDPISSSWRIPSALSVCKEARPLLDIREYLVTPEENLQSFKFRLSI